VADFPAPNQGYISQWTPSADATGRASTVPSSAATIAAKGAWVELFAATERAACGLVLAQGSGTLGSNRNSYLDIGIGAGGSEVVLIPDIWFSTGNHLVRYGYYTFPVEIPKGSRLTCRANCNATSTTVIRVYAALATPTFSSAQSIGPVRMYGGTVSTVLGKALSVSSTAAENAWQEMTAGTEFDHRYLMLITGKDYSDSTMVAAVYCLDIGIGASGQESEIVRDLIWYMSSGDDNGDPRVIGPIPVSVPKGSRLSVRVRAGSTQTGVQVVLMGMG
jgi:hypothetical protein